MDEFTTLVSLPFYLIAPKDIIAPELHRESDTGKFCP